MRKTTPAWLVVSLWLGACDTGTQPNQPPGVAQPVGGSPGLAAPGGQGSSSAVPGAGLDPTAPGAAAYAMSRGTNLVWKRYAAVEADLMRSLELKKEEVCSELGDRSCTRDVHIIALGGNDPFRSGIHRPSAEPSATTSVAIDRVLLSACSARARADKTSPAKVFTAIDLRGAAPAPDAPAVDTTIRDLYRRLLARDPKAHETMAVKSLLDPSAPDALQSAEEFAALACYVIGSSIEFLFD